MDNKLYPESYGNWAGNPVGIAPDFTRCCEKVTDAGRAGFARSHQCRRERGFGPDEAYCAQHNPEKVAARRAKRDQNWRDQRNKERYNWHGRLFFDALKKIADGHNDALGLAQEVIAEFEKGAFK